MNLIQSPWMPTDAGAARPAVALRSRSLAWPRADFDAASQVLLIGLLQTAVVKEPDLCRDEDDWQDLRDVPPVAAKLDEWFEVLAPAFEFDRFQQDFSSLTDSDVVSIGTLLADSPGKSTVETKTADLHRWVNQVPKALSLPSAAMALYVDNLFGVRRGTGHRQGVLGENRMLTVVEPDGLTTPWDRAWLNVLPANRWRDFYGAVEWEDSRVFPWLGETRTSETGSRTNTTTPQDVDPLQVYWQMPRRYRLTAVVDGTCGITGQRGPAITGFRRRKHGCNYASWTHPLAPYRQTRELGVVPLHLPGPHIGYDHWAGIACLEYKGVTPSIVVNEFFEQGYRQARDQILRLRCFEWHLRGGDVASWVDSVVPLVVADDRAAFARMVEEMMNCVVQANGNLRKALRRVSLHSNVSIYERTESMFFDTLRARDAGRWPSAVGGAALRLFDEVSDSARVDLLALAQARANLRKDLGRVIARAA